MPPPPRPPGLSPLDELHDEQSAKTTMPIALHPGEMLRMEFRRGGFMRRRAKQLTRQPQERPSRLGHGVGWPIISVTDPRPRLALIAGQMKRCLPKPSAAGLCHVRSMVGGTPARQMCHRCAGEGLHLDDAREEDHRQDIVRGRGHAGSLYQRFGEERPAGSRPVVPTS